MKNENEFLKIEDYLGPRKISINNMAINLLSTPIDRAHQTFELQDFENALLEKISPVLQSKLPTIQLSHSQQEIYDKKESTNKNSKLTEPNISDQEISALLAADLSVNRKLTVESFQYFQSMDPIISAIKENIIGKNTLPAYTLKKGIVCKIFRETESQEPLGLCKDKPLMAKRGNTANKDAFQDRRRRDNANKHIAASDSSGKNQPKERACQIRTGELKHTLDGEHNLWLQKSYVPQELRSKP